MAHGITAQDSMMVVRTPAWHRLGVVLDHTPRSLDEALRASGLTWSVAKEPLHRADWRAVDGWNVTVRQDTDAILGVVSDDYVVVQNRDCFAFLASLLGSELIFETAGSLWGGKQVFITARLPEHITVGGDEIRPYVVVSAWHTGAGAIRAMTTPVRAVCNNTVRAALARAHASYRVRHVGDPTGQLHEARAVLGLTVDYYEQFRRLGDRLALEPMSERALRDVLAELYPHDSALGGRALASRARARETVLALFAGGETAGNAPGSKWCAWNAIVEFHDHHGRPRSPEGAFVRKLEDPSGVKARALELVSAA
jgi:phage/plasmid-like protein (TIGR03299 family)